MTIVVTGYASLDYALRLDSPPAPDRTSTILSRAAEWPRLGGSPAYVAAALVAAGAHDALPISWVGDDAEGARYRDGIEALGVRTDGIGVKAGRTPICILAYQPDGRCHCLYDPGFTAQTDLDERQRALLAEAEAICVTVGPNRATREALRHARPGAALVWAVKADRRAVPPELAAELAARADVVIFSRGEADFAAEALAATDMPASRISIETRGRDGLALMRNGTARVFPVDPLEAEDSTGAGDTFVGGFLAAWIKTSDPEKAVRAGQGAARALLMSRMTAPKRS
ncbi:MAG TPA: carbohydrate kinase family protein [Roseiarcus sp.]|jgi:ribokinase|nr:carbohydrate kinase family protein [Roseiarcus sp.]